MFETLKKIFGVGSDKTTQAMTVEKIELSTPAVVEKSAEELFELGSVAFERGDSVTALELFVQAFQADPGHVKAALMLGFLYKERRNFPQANVYLEAALQLDPASADANYLLGSVAAAQNQAERMMQFFRRSLELDPHQERLYLEFSFALFQLGQGDQAITLLERGLNEFPNHLGMLQYQGNMHLHLRQHQQAHDAYLRAIQQAPESVELRYNQAICCMTLMRIDEALEHLMHIQSLQPDHIMANFEEGVLRLQKGEYERGWKQFQWRWKTKALEGGKFKTDKPFWDGTQDLHGKTILVLSEQGLGDSLQFCRFVPALKQRGAQVVFLVSPLLLGLMRQVPGVDALITTRDRLPPYDYYCELMSLPLGLNVSLATIPSTHSYLTAPAEQLRAWQERLASQGEGVRVGLVWAGNPHHSNDHMRSIPFELIRKLFDLDANFTVLQKDLGDAERRALSHLDNVFYYGDEVGDFTDSAALVELMDVVVTVDTSVAHLAGAMGKPTWILLSYFSDWRWLLNTEISPWYESVRLFRQAFQRPWQEPISNVKLALQEIIAKHV